MAIPVAYRSYYIGALELPIDILDETLAGLDAKDPLWEFKPYSDRFDLKSVIAHVADWNDIYRERLELTRDEDHPTLPDADEGQIAIDRDYDHSDPVENLVRFKTSRRVLIDMVKSLADEDWGRIAAKIGAGELSIAEHVTVIMAHDDYHLRQVLDYRRRFAERP